MGNFLGKRKSPEGKDLPEYDEDQLEWAKQEREDRALYDKSFEVWEAEKRHDAIKQLFTALVTTRPAPGSSPSSPQIRLAVLYGGLRACLQELPELYAMPSQNMSFLRFVPKDATPPLHAVFITRPHDLEPLLGMWMQPPLSKPVILSQFCMALELVLWLTDSSQFLRCIAAVRGCESEPERAAAECGEDVLLGGEVKGEHDTDGEGEGVGVAGPAGRYAVDDVTDPLQAEESKPGAGNSADDLHSFQRLVPGFSRSEDEDSNV